MNKKIFLLPTLSLFSLPVAFAHCPLCTIGAAAAAGGAAYLGVNQGVIGVFIGAFAVSMGWWVARLIKKKYIPFQKTVIIVVSFLTTIIPLLPLMQGVYPLYVSMMGDYGSLLNRTYVMNLFLWGSVVGGIIVSITPWLSEKITQWRNGKMVPYQGIGLTFLLLLLLVVVMQFVLI